MLTASMLLYTAAIVPFQICLWNYDDPCNKFPSLYFDVFVDTFFLVTASPLRAPNTSRLLRSTSHSPSPPYDFDPEV